jgi:hypothetical protein
LTPVPGGYALLGMRRTWWVQGDTATAIDHPAAGFTGALAPDGSLVRPAARRDGLLAIAPGAPVRTLREPSGPVSWAALFTLPGGGFLAQRTPGETEVLAADGSTEAVLAPRARLGSGLGGPFAGTDASPFAAAPDGAVYISDALGRIAVAAPPGSARALAAIELRRGGTVIGSVTAEVPPGETAVSVPAPPPGRFVVALRLTAADRREALHRMPVVTLQRLSRRLALAERRRFQRRSRSGEGATSQFIDLRLCARASATSYRCQAVQVIAGPRRRSRTCVGVWTATVRPDGVRNRVREAPTACRRLGPVR